MRRLLVGALALTACGDNVIPDGEPLAPAPNLTVVAHQDDDLLFMQPDLADVVAAKAGLTNVYVTAGGDLDQAERRYAGLLEAYAAGAGVESSWRCGAIELAGHAVEHCRNARANVSLVFLAYPDGGKYGERADSLLHLWTGHIARADAVSRIPASYDQAGLVAALARVIDDTQPQTIRTLEIAATHGRDHSDHMLVGALTLLAVAEARSTASLISYRGYATELEPETMIGALYDRSAEALAHYHACANECAACGSACPTINPSHDVWLRRRYAVAMRPAARGVLRAGRACLAPGADHGLGMTACTDAPSWELAADGTLRTGERCAEATPAGDLRLTTACSPAPARRFFLDDEGHLFVGIPPASAADYAHTSCVVPTGDRARVATCGAEHAPTWELAPIARAVPRPVPALPGRAIRLADLTGDGRADVCFVQAHELACAAGAGDGTFFAVTPIAALAIEPESLVLGDVDGDGHTDACGRDRDGITCALAATGFAATRFTDAFARGGGASATDRSLTVVDVDGDGRAEICGLDEAGVVCARRGSEMRAISAWPPAGAPLWVGDLDGDARADWCITNDDGVHCGRALHHALTRDGAPWSYAFGGVRDPGPASLATSALADLDGDGRAELCRVHDRSVTCTRSQGGGFGPPVTFAVLPPGGPATALWLGDLDGDGTLDACVDDGPAIHCALRLAP